ncbi:MAG: hypothetical protein KDA75_21420, partial [Planctomycetaceae bacterium]|nr:hypothetical protein [Planctomycetaceae bacterium]
SRPLRLAAIAVCALLLQVVFTTSAYATCGDWLAETDMEEGSEHRPDSDHGSTPCHGPSCRPAPATPLPSVPVPTTSSDQDRWVQSTSDDMFVVEQTSRWLRDEAVRVERTSRGRLERPPRALR